MHGHTSQCTFANKLFPLLLLNDRGIRKAIIFNKSLSKKESRLENILKLSDQ